MQFILENAIYHYRKKPFIMGILNATPDSFSDGGKYDDIELSVKKAIEMSYDGASIIDIGGESTRPGAEEISIDEEISRVIPIIEKLRTRNDRITISIDTRKSEVAEAAIIAGADIINDVSGLQFDKRIVDVAAKYNAGLIIMHSKGNPDTMQNRSNTTYENLMKEIMSFLSDAADYAISKGVRKESIMLDPGVGFAKDFEQNIELIKNINILKEMGYPILVGPSRKAFIGKIINEEYPIPSKRSWGTAGVIAWLANKDVEFVRVHDVKEINQLLTVLSKFK